MIFFDEILNESKNYLKTIKKKIHLGCWDYLYELPIMRRRKRFTTKNVEHLK